MSEPTLFSEATAGESAARPRIVTIERTPSPEEEADLRRLGETALVRLRIATPDRRLARLLEPDALPPARRLAVLRRLRRGGLRPGILLAPLVPGIHDHERDLLELLGGARAAGASFVSATIVVPSEERTAELRRLLAERYPRVAARLEVHLRTSSLGPAEEFDRVHELLARLARRLQLPVRGSEGRPVPHPPLQRRFAFAAGS